MKVKRPSSNCCTTNTTSSGSGTVTLPDGIMVLKGNWNGASDAFPAGGILKGWSYKNISDTVNLLGPDGGIIPAGVTIVAEIDNPGPDDWTILNSY